MKNKLLNIIGIVAVIVACVAAHHFTKQRKVIMDSGIQMANMDTTVRAGDDFYDFATGGWRKSHPIPDDYTRYGVFEVLRDTNLKRVREIAENDDGKIGTLYKIAMNDERLNADKTAPVAAQLAEIDAIKSAAELPAFLGRMHRITTAFWGDGVGLDETDSTHYLYNIGQGGLGLARDYYFDSDPKTVQVRKKYLEFITRQMKNFGVPVNAQELYNLELRMACSFYPKEKLRDPHANYHKMTIAEVKERFPNFDWDAYLAARGATAAQQINIAQPEAIAESIAILNDTDLNLIKTYLKYQIVCDADTLLDDATYEISFDFYNRTMAGQKEPKPRWKRAVSLLDGTLGEEIGRLYVQQYFPADAKARMQKLVKNLQRALGMRIENLEWMSDATKAQALKKLGTFHAKIGYPDKWRDYSKLNIDANASLWENMLAVSAFEDEFWLNKIGAEKDPTLWYMNAHEINAYYDPSTNEVCFPAGILQYPFFDMAADDAFNYGAIGSIIGHEMTHGFDDSGRHFDANGNMTDWWTADDAAGFEKRADVLRAHFDKIVIAGDVHANGTFTLGENLADYGGITVSFTAYKNFGVPSGDVDGFTADQRFFIAYATSWAQNIRGDEELRLTKIDEHSLAKNRVNGILPHIAAWYDAFSITPDDALYVAPENRIKLW